MVASKTVLSTMRASPVWAFREPIATLGGFGQWLWAPQTSVTAVKTGLPVTPPPLVTHRGEPASILSWCTVAGRQQRAPLACAGKANRPLRQRCEIMHPPTTPSTPPSGGHTHCRALHLSSCFKTLHLFHQRLFLTPPPLMSAGDSPWVFHNF